MILPLRDVYLQGVGADDCIGWCEKGDQERVGVNGEIRGTPHIPLSGLGEWEGSSGSQQLHGCWSCVGESDPNVRPKSMRHDSGARGGPERPTPSPIIY